MDEKNVKALSSLLGADEATVKTAVEEDGGLVTLAKDFKEKNQVFNLEQFAKLKENFRKEVLNTLSEDDIPKEFKAKAVGWKLEALEKEIKEEYGFDGDHKNLKDLVNNIVEQAKTTKDDDTVLKENQQLKDQIKLIAQEKADAVKAAKDNFDKQLITHDFNDAIDRIGLDYEEGEALKKQKELLKMSFNGTFKLSRKDDNTIVIGEDGKAVSDMTLDPLKLDTVLSDFAKTYGFQLKEPDSGGQGGGSSKQKNTEIVGKTYEEYRESKGVKKHTAEDDALYAEYKKANPQ